MTRFAAIDLADLPSPNVIEALSFEAIKAAMIADFIERFPEFSAALESDPALKLIEVFAYRELLVRARVNDAGRAVMLAHAVGADLDNLAAFYGVARQVVTPADLDAIPPVEQVLEADDRLRARTQLALEGFTTAGSVGAYTFYALSSSPLVKDVSVVSLIPGDVTVSVLSSVGDGTPDAPLLAAVDAALNLEQVRPLNDTVIVQAATILTYSVDASLSLFTGPDAETVRLAALAAVQAYVDKAHALGFTIRLSALYAALHQAGVESVSLTSPLADIDVASAEAAYCTGVTVTVAS